MLKSEHISFSVTPNVYLWSRLFGHEYCLIRKFTCSANHLVHEKSAVCFPNLEGRVGSSVDCFKDGFIMESSFDIKMERGRESYF
jgi:hypothetical protein